MIENNSTSMAASFAAAPDVMLAAIFDQSADCIKVISASGAVEYMNRNGQCAMEIDDFCAVAGKSWGSLWPDEAQALIERSMEMAKQGEHSRFEAYCPTAKGTPRWWDVSVSPLRGASGELDGFIATSRDVTESKNQFELRDAMAHEMRHRLRNKYVVVGSLLRAYSRGKPEHGAFVGEMIDRLNGLSIAQTMTADGNSCLLADLVPALLEPYITPDCDLAIGEIPVVRIGQSQVDTLVLVLGELAVNSTKHGALGGKGTIQLNISLVANRIEFAWSERSDRKVAETSREGGQGLRLIERVIALRSGSISRNWAENGLDVIFTLPAAL